jgi:hypothetical protein
MPYSAMLVAATAKATITASMALFQLPSPDIAAENSVMAHHAGSTAAVQTPKAREFVVGAPETIDVAMYLGNRNAGAQVEIGALGGGRPDAPGLVHIGVGFDF